MNKKEEWVKLWLKALLACLLAVVSVLALYLTLRWHAAQMELQQAPSPSCDVFRDVRAYNITAVVIDGRVLACFETGDEDPRFQCREMETEACKGKAP